MALFDCTIDATCGHARALTYETAHGSFQTPMFMPVGTSASVKGITVRQLELGKAEAQLTMCDNHRNPHGKLHGGAYYTLADCAGGTACRTDGRKYVTLDGTIHFIRAAEQGVVTASAEVVHHGRTTSLVQIEIKGEDGTLYATGDFTFFCISAS